MRLLLLKSTKFAHQAGYYLQGGRWHSIKQDKPAPKGAPVSAHPHAAGKPVQKETLAEHEWGQLKLPDTNTNAGTFNKQLDQLKAAAANGDVTGILASGYGTNTYGKKLVIIANHVLGLLGSEHKVTAGQKAGAHAAVQTAPEIEAEQKHDVGDTAKELSDLMAADKAHQEQKAAKKPSDQPAPGVSAETVPAPSNKGEASSSLSMPEFAEGKQAKGVKAHYETTANKILAAAKAGDLAALQSMPKETGNSWKGKTENSKKLMALHQAAIAHVKGKGSESKPTDSAHAEGGNWTMPLNDAIAEHEDLIAAAETPTKADDKAELAEQKNEIGKMKQAAAEEKPPVQPATESPAPASGAAEKLAMIPWDKLKIPDANSNSKQHNSTVDKIKEMAEAGDMAGLQAMYDKKAGSKQTYIKKQALLAQTALAALEESAAAPAPAPAAEAKPAAADPAPAEKDEATQDTNDGPQEGETKQGADGMLVFHNGRWHKQGEEKAAADKPAPASPAEVEIPAFEGLSPQHTKMMAQAAAALKAKIEAEGKAGFKGVLTNHKTGAVTVNIDGIKIGKATITSKSPAFANFAKFVDELKASAGAVSKPKPAPKAATAAPAPAAAPEPAKELESMDHWTQTGGQGGSNPGGKFKDQDTAKAEVLAAKLYTALGLNAQDAKLVTKDGKVGIASRWQEVKKATPQELAKTPGVLAGFAADAWLANWDVVGLGFDNLQVDEKGNAMRVDAGGSLMYRAQGGKKAFGDTVTELDSLRDKKLNPQAAAVFGGMSQADITASVAKVAQISDAQIRILVNTNGPGTKAERKALADTLIARKNDLLAKYPKAAKQTKKRLDPEQPAGEGRPAAEATRLRELERPQPAAVIEGARQRGQPEGRGRDAGDRQDRQPDQTEGLQVPAGR